MECFTTRPDLYINFEEDFSRYLDEQDRLPVQVSDSGNSWRLSDVSVRNTLQNVPESDSVTPNNGVIESAFGREDSIQKLSVSTQDTYQTPPISSLENTAQNTPDVSNRNASFPLLDNILVQSPATKVTPPTDQTEQKVVSDFCKVAWRVPRKKASPNVPKTALLSLNDPEKVLSETTLLKTPDASNLTSTETQPKRQNRSAFRSDCNSGETGPKLSTEGAALHPGSLDGQTAVGTAVTNTNFPLGSPHNVIHNIEEVSGQIYIASQMSIYVSSDPHSYHRHPKMHQKNQQQDCVSTSRGIQSKLTTSGLQTDAERTVARTPSSITKTPLFHQSVRVLNDKGLLLLCGPPYSGKSWLGEELVEHFKIQGFTITSLDRLSCLTGTGRYFLWMDGGLGEVEGVNTDKLRRLKDLLKDVHQHPDDYGQLLVLVTLYPHILQELRKLEFGSDILIRQDDTTVLNLTQDLTNPEETFKPTLKTYYSLLHRMITQTYNGNKMATLLALSMLGLGNFLHDPERIKAKLQSLGLKASCAELDRMAFVLRGFILNTEGSGFHSRLLYNTAGLVLGQWTIFLPVLLKVCDVQFLIEFVRTKETLPEDSRDNDFVKISTLSERHLFVQRVQELLEAGDLLELCHHPSLYRKDFLEEVRALCSKKSLRKLFIRAGDREHKLSLLYWSAWSLPAHHLSVWCLELAMKHPFGKKARQTDVILSTAFAMVLISHPDGLDTRPHTHTFLSHLLSFNFKAASESKLTLKLPLPTRAISDTTKNRIEKRVEQLKSGVLCYLEDPLFPIPPAVLTVTATNDMVTVELPSQRWYLALRLLLDNRVDETDQEGNTILHVAIEAQDEEVTMMALRSGASLTVKNKQGLTPYDFFKNPLWTMRARIKGVSPLHEACKEGRMDEVRRLLCTGLATVHTRHEHNDTPLHSACRKGHKDIAVLLLQLGAEVNVVNKFKVTPLIAACYSGHSETCRLLLQQGADLNRKANCGTTALHAACRKGYDELVDILLDHGADINTVGPMGYTALHEASVHNHERVVSLLLHRNALVNNRDYFGQSPLHRAIKCGHPHSLVKLLLRHNAEVNIKDWRGWSPLDLVEDEALKLILTNSVPHVQESFRLCALGIKTV